MKKIFFTLLIFCSLAIWSYAQPPCNTVVGVLAGVPVGGSDLNTHIGCSAGSTSINAVAFNTFIGAQSGEFNTSGLSNTFLGYISGQNNVIGSGNTFLGVESGLTNSSGNANTFVGLRTGVNNSSGSENSYFGYEAGGDPGLNHSSAIGANAFVCTDFTISIGTINDYTVIGDCQPRVNPFTGNPNRLSVVGGDLMVDANHYITNPTLAPGGVAGLVTADPTGTLQPLSFTGNPAEYLGGDGNWYPTSSSGSDQDWYEVGTMNAPNNINDDIWTDGRVYIDWGMNPTPPNMGPDVKLYVNGAIQTSMSYIASDRRFKKNIRPIANSLSKISKIKGVSYEFNREAFADRKLPTGSTMGFLAQNLKEVTPELVKTADDGYMAVNYDGVVALLVEGINEQQEMIEAQNEELLRLQAAQEETQQLRAELDQLKAAVQTICNEGCGNLGTIQNFDTQHRPAYWESVQLSQNQPNPFNNSTSIQYDLPAEVQKAELVIYDLQGRQLKSYPIDGPGKGTIEITKGSLADGMYLYHLLIEGKASPSLKMILSDSVE